MDLDVSDCQGSHTVPKPQGRQCRWFPAINLQSEIYNPKLLRHHKRNRILALVAQADGPLLQP